MDTSILACIDILNIPGIAGKYVGTVWVISLALAGPVFIITCVYEYSKFLTHNEKDPADFIGAAFYLFWFFSSFLIYNLIMKFAYLFDYVSLLMVPIDDWANFLTSMINVMDKTNSGSSLLSINIQSLIMWVSLFLATGAESLFLALRFILLEMAYVIGPLLILAGVYRPLRYISKGWVILFIQISFWPITMKLVESAMLALQFNTFIQDGNPFIVFILSFLMVVMYFIGIPALTSTLLSQKNMGSVMQGVRGALATATTGGAVALIEHVKGFGSGLSSQFQGMMGGSGSSGSGTSETQSTIPGTVSDPSAVKDDKSLTDDQPQDRIR